MARDFMILLPSTGAIDFPPLSIPRDNSSQSDQTGKYCFLSSNVAGNLWFFLGGRLDRPTFCSVK